jgi:hypothetical protein
MNPINKILAFFSNSAALVGAILASPKLYRLSQDFVHEYIARNIGTAWVDIGLIAWMIAVGLLTYSTLQLLLFMLTASLIARYHD